MTGDLLQVHACKHRPQSAAVAVKYKGYRFYFDDRDLNSQSTFQLLLERFSIEIRGGGGQRLPVLTLGVKATACRAIAVRLAVVRYVSRCDERVWILRSIAAARWAHWSRKIENV